jgi:hypothetical protein
MNNPNKFFVAYGKMYEIDQERVDEMMDSVTEWRALLFKGYSDRNFKGFWGTEDDLWKVCNSGSSSLNYYSAREIEDEIVLSEEQRCSIACGILNHSGGGYWANRNDSDEGECFPDFWSAASYIFTYDKQDGGTWNAQQLIDIFLKGSPNKHFIMISALLDSGAIEEVED